MCNLILSAIVTLGNIRPEDSRAVFCIAKPKYLTVWACLGVNPLVMPNVKIQYILPLPWDIDISYRYNGAWCIYLIVTMGYVYILPFLRGITV